LVASSLESSVVEEAENRPERMKSKVDFLPPGEKFSSEDDEDVA
jgi:hypothetical protein